MFTDEKLLEAAAQLSSEESSEEEKKEAVEELKGKAEQSKRKSRSHRSRRRDDHPHPRAHKEHHRSTKGKKGKDRREDWLAAAKKERRKLVEAEVRAGQKNRLRKGMLLPPGSDDLLFEADSIGDYGNLAFGCPSIEAVPKYSKGLGKKQEKGRQVKQPRIHVERSDKVGFDDSEEFVGFSKDWITKNTAFNDLDFTARWDQLDEEMIIKETRRFNIQTREDPHNVDLWLEFANFQENMVRYLKKKGSKVKFNALQKKIAVLERGLSFNPDSDQLMLELLNCAEKIRPPEEMEGRWHKAVSYLHSSVDMWRAYVSRQRQNRSSFDAMFVSQSYRSAILAIYRSYKMEDTEYYSNQKFHLAKDLVDITLECIQFHFESNMTEYAVSMIQAWLEYQYLSPKDWPEDAIEAMFQEFWSSGAPLVGEEGGEGWGTWFDSCQNAVGDPKNAQNLQEKPESGDDRLVSGPWDHLSKSIGNETNDNEMDIIMNENAMTHLCEQDDLEKQFAAEFDALMDRVEENPNIEIVKTWMKMEDKKDSMHFLRASHARSNQEQDNDSDSDPLEKVDWHEIIHCLMRIDQPKNAQYSLLIGCLELLGVIRDPVPHFNINLSDDLCLLDRGTGCTQNTFDHWSCESLLPGPLGRGSLWWTKSINRQTFCIRLLLTISPCIEGPLQSILLSAAITLASCDASQYHSSAEHSNGTNISFTKNESLVKDILSRYSSMFSLWGTYAYLKAASGSFKMAKKVFKNCIKSNDSIWDVESLYDRAQLCIFQAKSEILSTGMNHADLMLQYPHCLLQLKKEQALSIITSHIWFVSRGSMLVEADKLSDTLIIDTRKKFQNLLSELCARGSQLPASKTNLICTLEVAASFELLVPIARSESPGILPAMHLYQHILSEASEMLIDARTIDDPLSFDISVQQQCSLAVFTSHSFPLLLSPGAARTLTLEALSLWPGHPAFLRILSIHEQSSYNMNSLRREISILIARSKNPIMEYLFLMMAEIKSGSSLSSVASLLERALQHALCKACPLLWRLRLRLASQLETQRQPLMNIFLRSIDACPWAKNVWMDGIEALYQSAHFSCKEIMDLIDVMRWVHDIGGTVFFFKTCHVECILN